MKKAMFGAIFAALLMLSLPVVSTVQAGPELIAKNSSGRYVPEFVKATVQELRSIVDRIMELAGDDETIIKQCKELYDALDNIESGREPALTPVAGGQSTEDIIATITQLYDGIRENYGVDVADEIFAQANKELRPIFGPMFGKDFDVKDMLSGDSSSGFAVAGIAGIKGYGIPVDPKKKCAYNVPVPVSPGTLTTYNNGEATGTASTGWSDECYVYLLQFILGAYESIVMILIIATAVSDVGGVGALIMQTIAAALGSSFPLLLLVGAAVDWAIILGVTAYTLFMTVASLWSFIDADCLGQLLGQSGDDGTSVGYTARVGGPARKVGQ